MEEQILSMLAFVVFAVVVVLVGILNEAKPEKTSRSKNQKIYGQPIQQPRGVSSKQKPAENILREFLTSHLDGAELREVSTEVSSLRVVSGNDLYFSGSDPDARYSVDIGKQTCTCPNFEKRDTFQKDDMRRWCKHLVHMMDEHLAFEDLPEEQKVPLLQRGKGASQIFFYKHPMLPEMFLVPDEDGDWLSVIARQRRQGERVHEASGQYARFGWNYSGQRWAYGDGAPGASYIRKFLIRLWRHGDLNRYADISIESSSRKLDF